MSNSNSQNKAKLIEGPIGITLLKLAVPMVFGLISVMLFNLVDTWFVGKLGTTELAAISFTFPITYIMFSVMMGFSIGTSAMLAKAIGAGDHDKAQKITIHSLSLSSLVILLLALLGYLTIDDLFLSLGASADTLPFIRDYMQIWYAGIILLNIPIVGNGAMRATGDTISPSIVMLSSTILNMILDPIFIFGYGPISPLGVKGAAIATVISWLLCVFVALNFLHFKHKMIMFRNIHKDFMMECWRKLLWLSIPASSLNLVIAVSMAIVTAFFAQIGPAAVAAYGVAGRIESLAFVFLMALSASLGPFVGQNWGAGKLERVQRSQTIALQFSLIYGFGIALLLFILAEDIASFFTADDKVALVLVAFLQIVPISYALEGATMMSYSALNAVHKPVPAAVLNCLQFLGLYVPFVYLGAHFHGVQGAIFGMCLANLLAGSLLYIFRKRIFTTLQSEQIQV